VIDLFGGMFLDSGTEIGYNLIVSGKEHACLHGLGSTIAEAITGVVLQLIELGEPKNLSGHDSVATVPR
jgi:transketolase C-terminal domain/subunit